mgnify:CR=1 FL=1
MLNAALQRFSRLELVPSATPLERLERLSAHMNCDIWVKRDDLTPLAMGGNKVRKLEYLGADALRTGADCLVTAGAIQSNHVRQTAALAARQGMACHALLENPLGYVRAGLELAQQIHALGLRFAAVVVASGSAGTQAGLSLALAHEMPELPVIGITVSRPADAQRPKVMGLIERCAALLGVDVPHPLQVQLWDEYHGPCYGEPNEGTQAALHKLARCEGLLLDPVYTGKAMDGLLDGIALTRFAEGPVLFVHTGGTPALFAYHPAAG